MSGSEETPSRTSRCGFVVLAGAPNAGKSTLLNRIVGAKLSIVTHKVQTTRTRVRGVAIADDTQLVFVDTPGIFHSAKRRLERAMVASAWNEVEGADAVVLLCAKAHLISRDIDILAPMAEKNLTRAMVSITTQDKKLARSMEPRASAPAKRFDAIKALADAGVPVGIMTGPMIPGLNDDEMETIMEKAADLGASFSAFTVLRLPLEVSPLFQEWLEAFAPTRAKRIMGHIRDMNGGRDYDPHWSRGREIKTPYARLIGQRNAKARHRLGFDRERAPLDLSQFRVPAAVSGQLSLFE